MKYFEVILKKKTSSHTWNSLSIVPILVSPAIFVITSSYNENKKIIKITHTQDR